jgi:ketosteroid isomerase-like protein
MFTKLNVRPLARNCAVAALLCGVAISSGGTAQLTAQADPFIVEKVRFTTAPDLNSLNHGDVTAALATFISGMADGDAEAVWMFASEEEQAAFGTEEATYAAYAEDFPALTRASEVTVERVWDEGVTPFVALTVRDISGRAYKANVGFWLDDAGDWKVISLDVRAAAERAA